LHFKIPSIAPVGAHLTFCKKMKCNTESKWDELEFISNDYGWRTSLDSSIGTFFGMPLTVDISTRHIPNFPEALPDIHDEQRHLVYSILDHIEAILREAENQLEKYYISRHADFNQIRPMLADPRVWIHLADTKDMHDPQPRNDNEWTLVVGFRDAPDFGHHIEFDLDQCVDVWAGD
jgi:hypothetical protein